MKPTFWISAIGAEANPFETSMSTTNFSRKLSRFKIFRCLYLLWMIYFAGEFNVGQLRRVVLSHTNRNRYRATITISPNGRVPRNQHEYNDIVEHLIFPLKTSRSQTFYLPMISECQQSPPNCPLASHAGVEPYTRGVGKQLGI